MSRAIEDLVGQEGKEFVIRSLDGIHMGSGKYVKYDKSRVTESGIRLNPGHYFGNAQVPRDALKNVDLKNMVVYIDSTKGKVRKVYGIETEATP